MPPPGVLDPPEVLDQVGVLDQLDAKVKVYDNGRRPGGTVKRCEWRLRVRVRSKEKFWPRKNIQVELEGVRGTAGSTSGVTRMQSTTSAEVTFSGSDPHDYTVRANVEDWILVAPKDATLKNGDDKLVELEILCYWIDVRLEDYKTGKPVRGVTIKFKLPGTGEREMVTEDQTLHITGKTQGTCEIQEMRHADMWEFVEYTSA